jgi:hypothetical protein
MEVWNVAYDIRDTVPWKLIGVTCVGWLLSIVMGRVVIGSIRHREWTPAIIAAFGFLLAFGAGVVGTVLAWYGEYSMRSSLTTGEVETVVGPVEKFHSRSTKGRTFDLFTVGGQAFNVDPAALQHGLTRPMTDGGPCRNGRVVRIAYRGSCILRVETMDGGVP